MRKSPETRSYSANQAVEDAYDIAQNIDVESSSHSQLEPLYNESYLNHFNEENLLNVLENPHNLNIISHNYLDQYNPDSTTIATRLATKEALDHYILKRLSDDNAESFLKSLEFKNYSNYIIDLANQKKFSSKNGKINLYPELFNNPVLKNPSARTLVFQAALPDADINSINNHYNKDQQEYQSIIKNFVENGIEKKHHLSQKQFDILGDYIYSGRNFNDGVAEKYAEFCFNEIQNNPKLKPSVSMLGALTNYFASCYSIDEKVRKNSHFFIASQTSNDPNRRLNIGTSTRFGCILEKDHFLNLSLTSDESLNKPRTNKYNDLYRLMMISFHEVTHDHQKNMVEEGKDTNSAMSYILKTVLNRGNLQCFEKTKSDGTTINTSYYRVNHDSDEIEIEADEEAWIQCRTFLVKHQKERAMHTHDKELLEKATERQFKCLDNRKAISARRVFSEKLDETGETVSSIQYDMIHLKQYVNDNPSLLNQFPQLNRYIDSSGNFQLSTFFNGEIASIDYTFNAMDSRTDIFGVEIGSYLLTNQQETRRLVNFLENNATQLSDEQITNFLYNCSNIVQQNALRSEQLADIDPDKYDETRTYGKDRPLDELGTEQFKQYLHQVYNCIHLAEIIRAQRPDLDELISKREKRFIDSNGYLTLSKNCQLPREYAQKIANRYTKTQNPTLLILAHQIQKDYNL